MMEDNILYLDEYFVEFGGGPKYCCDLNFTNEMTRTEFTELMSELYGDVISKKWYFVQSGKMPTKDESNFDLAWGNIKQVVRTLSSQEIKEAIQMIMEVAKQMELKVVARNQNQLSSIKSGILTQQDEEVIYEPKKKASSL